MKFGGFKNMRMSSKISLILLILVALTAILAPLIAPHDPLEIFTARQLPVTAFCSVPTTRVATFSPVCFTVAATPW